MFLDLFAYCADKFPEISIVLEDILIPLISFITNNSLKSEDFKSKENPTFFMENVSQRYKYIFTSIIGNSLNDGMYNSKELSEVFKKRHQLGEKKEVKLEELNLDLYPKLPKNINVMFKKEFLIKYLYLFKDGKENLLNHLCYKDENISEAILSVIKDYLCEPNSEINDEGEVKNVIEKICGLFTLDDKLTEYRLETLFQLKEKDNLFDRLNQAKNDANYKNHGLNVILNLAVAMKKNEKMLEYFEKNSGKIQWIPEHMEEVQKKSTNDDCFSKVIKEYPDLMDIIMKLKKQ